ncbi:MAG: RNA polymerase sigma factor [Burkholderiales bacterium]
MLDWFFRCNQPNNFGNNVHAHALYRWNGPLRMPAEIGDQLVTMLPRLRRYALALARAAHAADDLVQSACERALATMDGPGAGVPFDAWMFRIVRNLWIDRGRRQNTEGIVVDIEEHGELVTSDGEGKMQARLDLDRVRKAIDVLPEDQREALILVCVEEMSYRDAAEVIGVPIGTIMSRLSRARMKLSEVTGL